MSIERKLLGKERTDIANRLFFRLYQCANMLHKTGTRAVEEDGLTTQQWAVLGALSRAAAAGGMGVGDLARYLKVSRQSLSGLLGRMERDGHIVLPVDPIDRRAKRVQMTPHGRKVWEQDALPKIHKYYEAALTDFSTGDLTHTLHYLLKLLENMEKIDQASVSGN
jgi:DNA-binding MarR family transcriptional regulator